MKLYLLLIPFIFLLSCHKDSTIKPIELRAHPVATDMGNLLIKLDASKSTGDVQKFGWYIDYQSPVPAMHGEKYSPNYYKEDPGFIPIYCTVIEPGRYVFRLIIWDDKGNLDGDTVQVTVK